MSSFTAGFIGLGLIGGSIVRAMKYYYPDCRILAFNRSRSTLEYALEEGIIDEKEALRKEVMRNNGSSIDYTA